MDCSLELLGGCFINGDQEFLNNPANAIYSYSQQIEFEDLQ